MTVVVYRQYDGMHYLAADQQSSTQGSKQRTKKIHMLDNDTICAHTGNQDTGMLMVEWLRDGEDLTKWPRVQESEDTYSRLIVVRKNIGIYFYETQPAKMYIAHHYAAWGSGRNAALGALYMKASTYEAVMASIEHDDGCGYGVDCYSVEA